MRRVLVTVAFVLAAGFAVARPVPADATARLVAAARAQVGVTRSYDPAYVRLAYPGGDVPADRGVCSDVVVRALRAGGLDLQKAVHDDMRAKFSAYPTLWGLTRTDPNIDHRRVPNLARWFERQGAAKPITQQASDYRPGDIVAWRLMNGLAHIGVLSDRRASDGSGRFLVIHNIGQGAREEDVLFAWHQTGHYRWPGIAS
jgi:uncharacterized protein